MQKLTGKEFILGIQHMFAMFGATVLVPLMTGLNPLVALFAAGVGTLLFHWITKKKVPVFLGSSFAFIAAIQAVIAEFKTETHSGIAEAGGGIICAGFIYLLLSIIAKFVGVDTIKKLVPPVVSGPIIIVIGVTLSPTAIMNSSVNWPIAIFVLLVVIGVSIFSKGFFKLVPILIGIVAGFLAALLADGLGWTGENPLLTFESVRNYSWFTPYDIIKGKEIVTLPAFNIKAISMIAPISIVTFMEHIGDITTNGAVVKKNFFEDPGLHRTLLGDGVATMFAGFLGAPPNTTYSENTGVLAVTKNYNPMVLRLAAVFAIFLSLFGKLGGLLQSIPTPVMGGISIVLFGMIASIGMRTLAEAELDFSHSRNLIIIALILVMGLGGLTVTVSGTVQISGLAIAALVGIVANQILPQDV